ncbi:unnamed protein product [Calicophoron daubneyi]|uniref:Topoisomerase I damage affected protein 11 n=1 Tax=Calicophoron daubneyi TaxID=300641 RepID=A0AAV2T1E8_CALDB
MPVNMDESGELILRDKLHHLIGNNKISSRLERRESCLRKKSSAEDRSQSSTNSLGEVGVKDGKQNGRSARSTKELTRPPWGAGVPKDSRTDLRCARGSGAEGGCRIQDLCQEDRAKLARLVLELAIARDIAARSNVQPSPNPPSSPKIEVGGMDASKKMTSALATQERNNCYDPKTVIDPQKRRSSEEEAAIKGDFGSYRTQLTDLEVELQNLRGRLINKDSSTNSSTPALNVNQRISTVPSHGPAWLRKIPKPLLNRPSSDFIHPLSQQSLDLSDELLSASIQFGSRMVSSTPNADNPLWDEQKKGGRNLPDSLRENAASAAANPQPPPFVRPKVNAVDDLKKELIQEQDHLIRQRQVLAVVAEHQAKIELLNKRLEEISRMLGEQKQMTTREQGQSTEIEFLLNTNQNTTPLQNPNPSNPDPASKSSNLPKWEMTKSAGNHIVGDRPAEAKKNFSTRKSSGSGTLCSTPRGSKDRSSVQKRMNNGHNAKPIEVVPRSLNDTSVRRRSRNSLSRKEKASFSRSSSNVSGLADSSLRHVKRPVECTRIKRHNSQSELKNSMGTRSVRRQRARNLHSKNGGLQSAVCSCEPSESVSTGEESVEENGDEEACRQNTPDISSSSPSLSYNRYMDQLPEGDSVSLTSPSAEEHGKLPNEPTDQIDTLIRRKDSVVHRTQLSTNNANIAAERVSSSDSPEDVDQVISLLATLGDQSTSCQVGFNPNEVLSKRLSPDTMDRLNRLKSSDLWNKNCYTPTVSLTAFPRGRSNASGLWVVRPATSRLSPPINEVSPEENHILSDLFFLKR